MTEFYQCIICHHANISIMDLHNHHVDHHDAKELSQTIINLKGFRVYSDMSHVKQECLKPINLGDNNNNEELYNHIFYKPKLKNSKAYSSEQMTTSPRKFSHDETTCSINCSQFIAWEHELNKRTEINDEEFFNIIESLCCDLSKRKHRGRKKKHRTNVDKIDIKNVMPQIETKYIKEIPNMVDQLNPESIQVATTSFWNSQHSVTNANTSDEVLATQTEHKRKPTESNETTTVAPTKTTDIDKNTVEYDSLFNDFSWRSIIVQDIDQQDMSAEEENIYTKSMEPTIENLLS